MNAVNALAANNNNNNLSSNNNEGSYRRSMRSLDGDHRNEKIPMRRYRKRTSAIDSSTDLLLDSDKDALLSTSLEDKKDCSRVLREEELVLRYQRTNTVIRYFFEKKQTFQNALELFNRSHCVEEQGMWNSRGYFFECKGPIRVIQRMCTRCRDVDKPRTKTDLYYVDLGEKYRERTVYCHGCMGRVLHDYVGTDHILIETQLKRLRDLQRSGIFIFSRGNY